MYYDNIVLYGVISRHFTSWEAKINFIIRNFIYCLCKGLPYLIHDIWAFTVRAKFPNLLEQCPGLFLVTFIQADFLPGTVNWKGGLRRWNINVGAVRCWWNRLSAGGRATEVVRWCSVCPTKDWTTCTWAYAWVSCASGSRPKWWKHVG